MRQSQESDGLARLPRRLKVALRTHQNAQKEEAVQRIRAQPRRAPFVSRLQPRGRLKGGMADPDRRLTRWPGTRAR